MTPALTVAGGLTPSAGGRKGTVVSEVGLDSVFRHLIPHFVVYKPRAFHRELIRNLETKRGEGEGAAFNPFLLSNTINTPFSRELAWSPTVVSWIPLCLHLLASHTWSASSALPTWQPGQRGGRAGNMVKSPHMSELPTPAPYSLPGFLWPVEFFKVLFSLSHHHVSLLSPLPHLPPPPSLSSLAYGFFSPQG